ncbi:hypothetical protein GGR34_003257 [Microvirga flocculans]|uniref:DUF1311 domain-containing protein n=1 Tax=Microvirga flocculans TaxID=217168 RepID=A0A7W6N9K1_9HYPH|nr:hypothetical protein [Microvirga flocculans]MBB4041580.1 hypothetical protein [Microvirga flocculans]
MSWIARLMALPLMIVAAWADELPRFDIEAMCKAAPRLESGDPSPYPNCVRDETEARNQLERQWSGFDARQREMCAQETSVGGAPSYVEILTCIQMATDNAKKP